MFMIESDVIDIPDVSDVLFRYSYISILRDDFFLKFSKLLLVTNRFRLIKMNSINVNFLRNKTQVTIYNSLFLNNIIC